MDDQLKQISDKIDLLGDVLQNFVIYQLIERGLGREDIRRVVKRINNAEFSAIYRAYKRSIHGQR